MPVDRPHLIVPAGAAKYDFGINGGGRNDPPPPAVTNRRAVSQRVLREVTAIVEDAAQQDEPLIDKDRLPVSVRATTDWGVNNKIPGPRRNEVLSIVGFARRARVNIALEPSTVENFAAAAQKYIGYDPGIHGRRPNHFEFFEAQPTLALTTVADLWASPRPLPDLDEEYSWEVWLRPPSEPRFRETLEVLGLRGRSAVTFASLRVIGLSGTRRKFERLARTASIAQLRPASSLNSDIFRMPYGVQAAAVTAAARRILPASEDAPAVCLLDTGVTQDHPLLRKSLGFCGNAGPGGPEDWAGHGTQMAGLALFENLRQTIVDRHPVQLTTRLESVVIQPPPGAATSILPALLLRRAVKMVEEASPGMRTFCFSMNAPDESDDGGPSSLSSEVDVLASDVAGPRLFCIAAGNLDSETLDGDYTKLNELSGILSPAQAWNALTVAACTHLVDVPVTHRPVASEGDLCPWSRTAVNWERGHRPPSKPDLVFEGGNQMIDSVSAAIGPHHDLCLLTTSSDKNGPLTLTGQTSAATATIAGLCATLQAEYPTLWPETIRGLVIHSCEHTRAMVDRAAAGASKRTSYQQALLERFGYGRPDRQRATENAEDALTLIVQGNLHPLRLNAKANGSVLGQMRFHELPWPIEVLEELGEIPAQLRVTLSYFIEPNPGAVIRGEADQYASHGLDFDVKRPDESNEQAIARVNSLYPISRRSVASPCDWQFGQARGRGGIKHDRLETTASAISRMGRVSVFPRKGWWGLDIERVEQQVRYALIVTIRTPEEEIYTRIASAIRVIT
jgi:hypothetical protein